MESEVTSKKPVHRNYIIASNLIFAVAAGVVIEYYLPGNKHEDHYQITVQIIIAIVVISLGLRVRRGDYWMKYRLALASIAIFAGYMLDILTTGISFIKQNMPREIEAAILLPIMIWILVLLFRVPKEVDSEAGQQK